MTTTDLIPGLDPTAFTTITGAQLAQLISSATFNSDKGCIIVTTDSAPSVPVVPDPSTGVANWINYIWLRIANSGATALATPYVWSPNASLDAILLKWQTVSQASLGANSIQGYMIEPNSIDKTKLTGTIDVSQVAGLSPLSQFLSAASLPSAAVGAILQAPGAGATPVWITKAIITLAEPTIQAYDQIPIVISGGIVYSLTSAAPYKNKLVSYIGALYSTPDSQNTTVMGADSAASLTTSQKKFSIGDIVTPSMTSGNKVRIVATLPCYVGSGAYSLWAGIYDSTAGQFIAYGHYAPGSAGYGSITIQYYGNIPATGARTYDIYFGSTNGTAINVKLCAAQETASIVIEELA